MNLGRNIKRVYCCPLQEVKIIQYFAALTFIHIIYSTCKHVRCANTDTSFIIQDSALMCFKYIRILQELRYYIDTIN